MLAGHGYRVFATTGANAAEDARRLQPAAILLDLVMPDRDGERVLDDLKSDPSTSSIPVIVVSIVDAADVPEVAGRPEGKPVSKDDVLSALAKLRLSQVES